MNICISSCNYIGVGINICMGFRILLSCFVKGYHYYSK